jgi:acetamidase/formamidase
MRRLLPLLATCLVAQQTYELKPTPKTVVWGYHDAATPPVLKIKSGDIVKIETVMIASPEMLVRAGLPPEEVRASDREIHEKVTERGPGPHILTGPVYIEGAEPGDVLEVRIRAIDLMAPYAFQLIAPGAGLLPDDFPYGRERIVRLDGRRMVAPFSKGVEIPLRPFFGLLGVAPPALSERVSSMAPWIHTGNLDNKELVAGTTLYMPVHARGALFTVGDAHAAQGDGEICVTALETTLAGAFQFVVRKDMHLRWPRAETPTHFMTMGVHEDLDEAMKTAAREMIDWLVQTKGLSRDDAYMFASAAVDFRVTQVVDGKKGIHAMAPKSMFRPAQ